MTIQFIPCISVICNHFLTKTPAEPHPQTGQARQIISEIVKFDLRGQIKEKYLPYFVNTSANYVTPAFNTPYTTFTYDAMGRLIKATNPDSTYSTISYSDWVRTISDENGHSRTEYYDGYGKVIKIEEYRGKYPNHQLYANKSDRF